MGDPLADAVVEDLSAMEPGEVHAILAGALDDPGAALPGVPESLREFVAEANDVPDWYDRGLARAASRAFLRNSDIVLSALVGGSIVEGFATLISKPFRIRGRVMSMGVRRLKANGMQLVEQYLPGGMEPGGDGWRLTLRVRLVHAQSRRLLVGSEEWDQDRYGMPISAAHVLLAGAAFSGRLMRHVAALGGDFTREELRVALGGGLGLLDGKAFRIGHLGCLNEPMILGCLAAVETALLRRGIPHGEGGLRAAVEHLAAG